MAKTVKTTVGYDVDKQSENEAIASTERVAKAQENASKQTQRYIDGVVKKYAMLARTEGNVEKQTKSLVAELSSGMGRSTSEIDYATRQFNEMTASIRRAEDATNQLNNRFSRVSSSVAGAGDFQSNLGAIQGLTGSLGGGGGLSQGIGIGGEIVVLAEELPRLKEALSGLPTTIGNSVSALGASGVGLIGGIMALTAVTIIATQEAQRRAESARAILNAEREAREFASTATQEEIQARIESLQRQRGVIQEFADDSQRALDSAEQQLDDMTADFLFFDEIADGVLRLGMSAGITGGELDATRDSLQDAQTDIRSIDQEIQALTRASESAIVATNTQAQALEDLARQELELARIRSQELLESARIERGAIEENIRLNRMSADSLLDRRQALEDELVSIGAELNALRESGDTSEEVTARIAELNRQLSENAGLINDINQGYLPAIQAQEALIQAENERIETEQRLIQTTEQYNADVDRLNQQRAELEQRHADKLVSIAEKALADSESALQKLVDSQRSAMTDLERGNLEAQIDAQREERDSLKDHLRKLRDIRDSSEDAEFEAELNSDFRQLFSLRRQKTRSINEENQAYLDQREDQIEALDDQRQDRLHAYQTSLIDANNQYQQELRLIEQSKRASIQAEMNSLSAESSLIDARLRLRRNSWQSEIELASKGSQALLSIQAQTQNALLMQARTALGTIMTGGKQGFNFNGGGGNSYASNSVNNNNMPITINGGNAQQVKKIVVQTIGEMIK